MHGSPSLRCDFNQALYPWLINLKSLYYLTQTTILNIPFHGFDKHSGNISRYATPNLELAMPSRSCVPEAGNVGVYSTHSPLREPPIQVFITTVPQRTSGLLRTTSSFTLTSSPAEVLKSTAATTVTLCSYGTGVSALAIEHGEGVWIAAISLVVVETAT